MNTIIVPVDGASNIKLEVLDFETLGTIESYSTETPVATVDGLDYNCSGEEFAWFDLRIASLPGIYRRPLVIAPVARGASGGLVGHDNVLNEHKGRALTLAYTQDYPSRVDEAFNEIAGSEGDFFSETGSIRGFPGSLTLIKRFLFEEMERPKILSESAHFATYGALMSGHFLSDYIKAASLAGNEHSYWMCHSGARNITASPGTASSAASKIESFARLVPEKTSVAYKSIASMPAAKTVELGLGRTPLVIPGGHDTCLSHIPIMSTYYQAFPERTGAAVIHVEAGSWTMIALIGSAIGLPGDAFTRDVIVQGTVDGQPVVTARYGGGNDFRHVKKLFEDRGMRFGCAGDEKLLSSVIDSAQGFLLPNIAAVNRKSGPFPELVGFITDEASFMSDPDRAYVATNLTTAITTAVQVDALNVDPEVSIVLTAGGSRDPYFGRLLSTLTGRDVYGMYDCDGNAVSETTTLGAAITGKAAVLGVHPYMVDTSPLCISYRKLEPFTGIEASLNRYRKTFLHAVKQNTKG